MFLPNFFDGFLKNAKNLVQIPIFSLVIQIIIYIFGIFSFYEKQHTNP
jgi:hypothetical protein